MNNREAKLILSMFRPGTADENDPFFHEARELARTDPELARWFGVHCESYRVLREKFQSIPVPAGLKEQILSERKIRRPVFEEYARFLLAAAAVVLLAAAIIAGGFWPGRGGADGFASYRKRMTEKALRLYPMDLSTTNPVDVQAFLKTKKAPADYSLPSGLRGADVVGCAVTAWLGNPVSLICYKSGRPDSDGNPSDLWLFVTERKAVSAAPAPGTSVFARVNKADTVSWSDDTKNYLLLAVGDDAFLQKYIQ